MIIVLLFFSVASSPFVLMERNLQAKPIVLDKK